MDRITTYVERFGLRRLLSEDLIAAIREVRRSPGEHLIRAGDPMDQLLFFVSGKAKVYRRLENGSAVLIRFYRPFDILGDVELYAYDRYLMDVIAITETLCLGVGADLIRARAGENAALLAYLCGRLGKKLADFNVAAAINLRYPVENRLASYLLAVTDDEAAGGAAPDGASVSQGTNDLGELADLLGASYRQLSRAVRGFRLRGILSEERGRIAVIDRKKLEPLAGDYYL